MLSDNNDRPLILSDKNRGNVDTTCHQPVIYDVTVNNCYLLILPRCRFVYAHTFLTFLSNWSRDRIHPINGLDSSCKPHVTRAYQSVVWKILEWKHVSHDSSSTGMVYTTVWTFLRAGKLSITDWRGPSTNVSYFHYRSGLVSCCFADSTCHQPVMAASSLQELAAMRNLSTCELDKRRHLVTDVRTSKRHLD